MILIYALLPNLLYSTLCSLHCVDLRCDTVDIHEANGKLVAQQDSLEVLDHGTGN